MGQFYPFQIGGLEMGVIPLISAITLEGMRRGTPVNGFIVRKERKETGLGNKIEGAVGDETIIVLDDLDHVFEPCRGCVVEDHGAGARPRVDQEQRQGMSPK